MQTTSGYSKSRTYAQDKQQKSHGHSDHSDQDKHSNVSLESLKIRVKPVIRQHSIESSAERYYLSNASDENHLKNLSKESLQKKLTQDKKRNNTTNALKLKTRISFSESRLVNGTRNLDLNLVRLQMEKHPVLKMDYVTSIEKEESSQSLGARA